MKYKDTYKGSLLNGKRLYILSDWGYYGDYVDNIKKESNNLNRLMNNLWRKILNIRSNG